MKLVKAGFCDSEDQKSSFQHCGGPVRLVQACLCETVTPFETPRRCCDERGGLFKCQRRSREQRSPLWRPCEVVASLFMCGKDLTK